MTQNIQSGWTFPQLSQFKQLSLFKSESRIRAIKIGWSVLFFSSLVIYLSMTILWHVCPYDFLIASLFWCSPYSSVFCVSSKLEVGSKVILRSRFFLYVMWFLVFCVCGWVGGGFLLLFKDHPIVVACTSLRGHKMSGWLFSRCEDHWWPFPRCLHSLGFVRW